MVTFLEFVGSLWGSVDVEETPYAKMRKAGSEDYEAMNLARGWDEYYLRALQKYKSVVQQYGKDHPTARQLHQALTAAHRQDYDLLNKAV
jgi:hypothetical protein